MYTIRTLTFDNYVWFVEVASVKMLVEEVGRPELVNKKNIYMLAEKMIEDQTALIAYKDDKPVGTLGALLVPNTYNPEITTLVELIWYVLPEHRKSRLGYMLLEEYRKMAGDRADEAILSLLSSSKINHESLNKRGFKLAEQAFYLPVKEF